MLYLRILFLKLYQLELKEVETLQSEKSPFGSGTIMGSKKTKENNLLQTLVMFHVKERVTQRVEPRAQRAALRHFDNYF